MKRFATLGYAATRSLKFINTISNTYAKGTKFNYAYTPPILQARHFSTPAPIADTTQTTKKVLLIDGAPLVYRAYHGTPLKMTTPDGTPIFAVYSFLKNILNLVQDDQYGYVAILFDSSKKSFRKEMSPEYKAHRPPMEDDLRIQFPIARKVVEATGIPVLSVESMEADDVIATLAKKATEKGLKVTVVTPDKDMYQLVSDNVEIYDPIKKTVIDENAVIEKFGCTPSRLGDFLALTGDKSDNIAGISGVGPKTALKLLTQYNSIEDLIDNIANVKENKLREKLEEGRDNLRLARKLVTLRDDATLTVDVDDLSMSKIKAFSKNEEFIKVLDEYQFSSIKAQLEKKSRTAENAIKKAKEKKAATGPDSEKPKKRAKKEVVQEEPEKDAMLITPTELSDMKNTYLEKAGVGLASSIADTNYTLVNTIEALDKWITEIKVTGRLSFSTQLSPWKMHENNLSGISLCTSARNACYIPLLHTSEQLTFPESQSRLKENEFLQKLKTEVFENPNILKIAHSMKEQIKNLAAYDIQVVNYDDVMVMSYVLYCGKFDHDLETLLRTIMMVPDPKDVLIPEREVLGLGRKKVQFANASIVPLMHFVCQRSDFSLRMHAILAKEMLMQNRQLEFYNNIERPLVQTLADIELQGVCVDQAQLQEMEKENEAKKYDLKNKILTATGMNIIDTDGEEDGEDGLNINSNRQLGIALFDVMEIGKEHAKKSKKTGDYVLDAATLDAIAKDGHQIASDILAYRAIMKLQSTYIHGLQQHINTYDHRIHTTFQNAVTVTGRLSSTSPNLQNIPIRTQAGKMIRKCFVAPPAHVILKVDYSQVELRILAHIANIGVLKEAFKDGKDVHAITASQVFNVPLEGLDKSLRQKAKAINFGIIYGMSEYGLANRIEVTTEEAKRFINMYFKQYPGIKQYMDVTKEFCRKNGYVNTLFGRKCWIPDINSADQSKRGFAERTCINTPIQGTSADITKIAMNSIRRAFRENNIRTKMIIQVHDEIVFEAPEDEVEKVVPIIKSVMEGAANELLKKKFSVPLTVDVSIGKRWTDD